MAVEYHCRCRHVARSEAERRAHTDKLGHNEHVIATVVRPGVSAEWRERSPNPLPRFGGAPLEDAS